MPPTTDGAPHVTVRAMGPDDTDAALDLWRQSWLDTYAVPGSGVTAEWVESRWAPRLTQEGRARFARRVAEAPEPHQNRFLVACASEDVVGLAAPFVEPGRGQRVGALYVRRSFLGRGAGAALMQEVLDGFDPALPVHLQVATFNHRAIAFYERFGFRRVPGSDELYDDVIPEFRMRLDPS